MFVHRVDLGVLGVYCGTLMMMMMRGGYLEREFVYTVDHREQLLLQLLLNSCLK
jgi:hypothetical protein